MPAKPIWYSKVDAAIEELRASPRTFVDRATVEFLLGIGRRRAQQIMAPCVTDHVGANGLVDREVLIQRLRQLANGEDGSWERKRRRKVADLLEGLRQERIQVPRLLVEAPDRIVNQELEELPQGVNLKPGQITIDFQNPQEALERLLALAMAISNDFEQFERQVTLEKETSLP